jgi:hypothetical protein
MKLWINRALTLRSPDLFGAPFFFFRGIRSGRAAASVAGNSDA